MTTSAAEHFVTYFDHRFLVQGLALHESLARWCPGAVLWVLCLDDEARRDIERLGLADLRAIALTDVETPELLAAKANRSRTEYIYTLTPFTYEFVSARAPDARRITYVDADVFLFKSPDVLFEELERSGKSVLMTEHGYAPEYRALEATSGRFCVQFLPVVWDDRGREVVRSWQRDCLAGTGTSTANREAVFGDQKYLESWPERFPGSVHVSERTADLLAPWNAAYQFRVNGPDHRPVLYHFHSFRLLPGGLAQLCAGYRVGRAVVLYNEYLSALGRQAARLRGAAIEVGGRAGAPRRYWRTQLLWRALRGRVMLRRWAAE